MSWFLLHDIFPDHLCGNVVQVLLALERIEQDEELTYEVDFVGYDALQSCLLLSTFYDHLAAATCSKKQYIF